MAVKSGKSTTFISKKVNRISNNKLKQQFSQLILENRVHDIVCSCIKVLIGAQQIVYGAIAQPLDGAIWRQIQFERKNSMFI